MVRNVFRLDDRQVGSMMIPRAEIAWLDVDAPIAEDVLRVIADARALALSGVPRRARRRARRGQRRSACCSSSSQGEPLVARPSDLQPPVFVPETLSGMELLEQFRALERAAGVRGRRVRRGAGHDHRARRAGGDHRRVQHAQADDDAWAVQRDDGSWLLDGLIPVPELKDRLDLQGAARGGPRPLQHAGRHDHAAARPPAATPPTRSNGTAGASRWSTSTASASTRCSSARGHEPIAETASRMIHPDPAPQPGRAGPRAAPPELRLKRDGDDTRALRGAELDVRRGGEFGEACKEYPMVFIDAGTGRDSGRAPGGADRGVRPGAGARTCSSRAAPGAPTTCRRVLRAVPVRAWRARGDEQIRGVHRRKLRRAVGQPRARRCSTPTAQPTPFLKDVQRYLEQLELEVERTRLLGRRLARARSAARDALRRHAARRRKLLGGRLSRRRRQEARRAARRRACSSCTATACSAWCTCSACRSATCGAWWHGA